MLLFCTFTSFLNCWLWLIVSVRSACGIFNAIFWRVSWKTGLDPAEGFSEWFFGCQNLASCFDRTNVEFSPRINNLIWRLITEVWDKTVIPRTFRDEVDLVVINFQKIMWSGEKFNLLEFSMCESFIRYLISN